MTRRALPSKSFPVAKLRYISIAAERREGGKEEQNRLVSSVDVEEEEKENVAVLPNLCKKEEDGFDVSLFFATNVPVVQSPLSLGVNVSFILEFNHSNS